jgi:transketolase
MTTNRNGQHPDLDERSLQLRRIIVRMLEGGGRGHVGSALSLVEILRVLYDDVLKYDPHNPNWLDRDRFILSKGQGCLALYAVLADKGFFPDWELDRFCHSEGLLGGHPEIRVPGIEASTGSLGHGLAIGIGFALNAKYENSDYRTFVAIGDGESNEGSIWEGAMRASKHGLSNLTVLVDYNKQQSYGSTYEVQDLEPVGDKWRAFGFGVAEVDGHDVDQIRSVLANLPVEQGKPTTVVCHTVKGKGIDYVEGNLDWHHKNRLSDDDISALKLALEAG